MSNTCPSHSDVPADPSRPATDAAPASRSDWQDPTHPPPLSRRSFLVNCLPLVTAGPLLARSPGPVLTAPGDQAEQDWRQRCRDYLHLAAESPGPLPHALHGQIARLALGRPIDPAVFDQSLAFYRSRRDCVDFSMAALLRLLFLFERSGRLDRRLLDRLEQAVLDFRPWLYRHDRPVHTAACYWTENHQALYSSIEYLAGQRYPDRTFTWLGRLGAWHREHGRRNLMVWLAIKARYGMSEWLSPGYYAEDLLALLNVVDFAEDRRLAHSARRVMELLLLDLALHSFDGGMRATSGRSYLNALLDARTAATAPVIALAFGQPLTIPLLSGAAVALATSPAYRPPPALAAIANDRTTPLRVRQRSGISPEQALQHGFHPDDPKDIFTFWAMQAYTYPPVFMGNLAACRRWHIDRFTHESWSAKEQEIRQAGGDLARVSDHCATAMFGPHIETCRTADYQLSTAQDYRKAKPGYQQQIWLASLGGRASVWSSCPHRDLPSRRPNYWMGNAFLPRAAQYRNMVIALYRLPDQAPFPYTHLHFPTDQFDQVLRQADWLFGRKGRAYIAVASRPTLRPTHLPKYAGRQFIADGHRSAWFCRLGRQAEDGTFEQFIRANVSARLLFDGRQLTFRQDDRLEIRWAWDGPLRVNGKAVQLHHQRRYDCPWLTVEPDRQVFDIRCGEHRHCIDLSNLAVRPFRLMP